MHRYSRRSKGTDFSGTVRWREHFDPYGKKLNGVAEKRGFTGHSFDPETGLTYMLARYYDAEVGRFLQTDPIGSEDDLNLYAYVHGDPVNGTDPMGTEAGCVSNNSSCGISGNVTTQQLATAVMITVTAMQVVSMVANPIAAPLEMAAGQAIKTEIKDMVVGAAKSAASTERSTLANAAEAGSQKAGALVTKEGQTFTGLSNSRGAPFATNDTISSAVQTAKSEIANPPGFAGHCCEMNVTAQALNAGADVSGATAAAVSVQTGELIAPCAVCSNVLSQLGINPVIPP